MRGLQKNQIIAIIIAVACVTGFTLVSLNIIPAIIDPEVEYLPQFGGSYYVGDIQDANGNSSYSTTFHDDTFTILYWHCPGITVIDNNN